MHRRGHIQIARRRGHPRHDNWVRPWRKQALEAQRLAFALVSAHEDGLRLARELMIAQEFADAQEARAHHAIAVAASDPSDEQVVSRAIYASVLSEEADEDEKRAAARWGQHVVRVHQLIATVRQNEWLSVAAKPPPSVESPAPAE
jgi:hypothetical protein